MGILMYELLTGKLPYRGDNAVEIALKHLKEPLPSVREELPDIPQSVENVILKSAAKNPKNRYNDAREMYEDLKTCLDEARLDEPKLEYEYPELDGDNKKFTKQVEKAIDIEEEEVEDEDTEVKVKQVTDEEVKKENKLLVVLASIFTGLIVIVAAVFLMGSKFFNQKDIKIPDVSGKTEKEAIEILQDAGFEVGDSSIEISDDKMAEGLVVKTMPAANTKRAKGQKVTIYISTGDSKITVEDYKGKDYRQVRGALEEHGIYVYVEKKDVKNPKDYKDGVIIEQSVKAGEKLGARDSITLYIPRIDEKYPDFTSGKYKVADVQKYCDEHGVTLEIKEEANSSKNVGTIFYQSRAADSIVASGTTLTIKVAVKGNSESEAGNEDEQGCNELDGENCGLE